MERGNGGDDGNAKSSSPKDTKERSRRRKINASLILLLLMSILIIIILVSKNNASEEINSNNNSAALAENTGNEPIQEDLDEHDEDGNDNAFQDETSPPVVEEVDEIDGSTDGQESLAGGGGEEVVYTNIPEPDPSIAHVTPKNTNFMAGEDIRLWFSVGNESDPQRDDWIAIVGMYDDEYFAWQYTCNNDVTECRGRDEEPVSHGSVTFDEGIVVAGDTGSVWPLQPGIYQAILHRGDDLPYEILAMSTIPIIIE